MTALARIRRAVLATLSSGRESDRLRVIGAAVLALGIVGAGTFYWIEATPAGRPMDDLLPGYTKSRTRQIGMLMGRTGVMMAEWQDTLDQPGTQAVIIAAVVALFALYFFRAAWVLDHDEQSRHSGASVLVNHEDTTSR